MRRTGIVAAGASATSLAVAVACRRPAAERWARRPLRAAAHRRGRRAAAGSRPSGTGRAAPAAQAAQVMFVGNNWDGTATVVDVRTRRVDQDGSTSSRTGAQELLDDLRRPGPARVLPGDPAGRRRGPRPVRRRHVHHPRRQPARGVAAELRRRGLDRPGHRQGRRRAADGRLPDRPHERLARTAAGCWSRTRPTDTVHEYVMGGQGDPRTGHAAAHLRVGRHPAREQLQQERQADLPRQHRPGLHAGRLPRARPGAGRRRARRGQGRPVAPDRRQPDLPGPAPLGHGQGAGRGRLPRT